MSDSEAGSSLPVVPPDSPGSSVSTRLMDEYDELLKYAVVVPTYDPKLLPKTLADVRESFPQSTRLAARDVVFSVPNDQTEGEGGSDLESEGTPVVVRVRREDPRMQDFIQSPIGNPDDSIEELHTKDRSGYQERGSYSKPDDREFEYVYTATIDPDVGKMENLLDQWCLDLKRNVIAEFSQSKIRIVEMGRQQLQKEQENHASEQNQLLNEIDGLKELLHTYEQSIERKDQVISNLTHAMQKQKEKVDMLKKFNEWKIRHNDLRREAFASNLARRHYEHSLSQKVWSAWHSIIEAKWRNRVEKACQAKAQEVCLNLTNDYETKISSLNEALESARIEVTKLHAERDRYEETMKKAFMRGVCALNLEAMTMFQGAEEEQDAVANGRPQYEEEFSENLESSLPEKDYGGQKTIPQEPMFPSQRFGEGPLSRVVTSQGSRPFMGTTITQAKSALSSRPASSSALKGKVITAKVSAKVDSGRGSGGLGGSSGSQTLAPPMSSVIVERHQPVSKQTLGHATASKHSRQPGPSSDQQGGIIHRRIAGQSGVVTVTPNVQTVKVVQ